MLRKEKKILCVLKKITEPRRLKTSDIKATSQLYNFRYVDFFQDDLFLGKNEKCDISVTEISNKNCIDTYPKLEPRINEFGIQMISQNLYSQLFKNCKVNVDKNKINECLKELKRHKLLSKSIIFPDVSLNLPTLLGNSIEEHFFELGHKLSSPYKELLSNFISIPEMPEKWILQPGWTRYCNGEAVKVAYPLENALIFDVEVCQSVGKLPTIATAVSSKAWYGWVSNAVLNGKGYLRDLHYTLENLIPLEHSLRLKKSTAWRKDPRIVVGHNVSFDRARVREQYMLEQTALRFLDTMSLHICVSGVTSYQKSLLKAGVGDEDWSKVSSLNSLSKVHLLYCGSEVSKSDREFFISGSLADIKDNFQKLMSYCGNDVIATFNILCKIFPIFLDRFPHPVTLAGMLELQTAYIPVNKHWLKYISDSSHTYEDLELESKYLMTQCANDNCELLHDDKYKHDIWLWDKDWSVKNLTLKKSLGKNASEDVSRKVWNSTESSHIEGLDELFSEKYSVLVEKFFPIFCKNKYLPSRCPHLPGYPKWYQKLCNKRSPEWVPEPNLIGAGLKIVPKLLRLTWKLLPLHNERGHGWGYLVPYKTSIPIYLSEIVPLQELKAHFLKVSKNICSCHISDNLDNYCIKKNKKLSKLCKDDLGDICGLIKLPHKDGNHCNVGNPLSRDFINKFSELELSGTTRANRIIEISRMLSYWRNNRERIENQFVCWLKKNDLPHHLQEEKDIGVILPQVVVSGTLTRRAVEPTWMTASNAKVERVGSELRGIVHAPPGYIIVGADVDSQELWIASLLGDADYIGLHGATPLGWMTLNGKKSDGTDMHSVTAKAVNISRSHAKILNYARIYGAGQKFAERLLKQFNDEMMISEASEKAVKMLELTKGKKVFALKEGILPHLIERRYSRSEASELCSMYGKEVDVLFHRPQWVGGTESAMFNCLEEISSELSPKTPFLNCSLSRALEPKSSQNDKYVPTRINWVVQSSAVDFLHLMLVSMRWLLGSEQRFCLSFHDEVRYLVSEKYKYEAALALHITNLLTRAFCVSRVGMNDLPMSVAFFSSVEVDKVLRKESKDDNKTPSNPFGLSKGYGVPNGESLDIYEAIKKSKGVVGIMGLNKDNTSDS